MAGAELSLEDFKARLPLAEIVGRYVKLTRRGREHQGLCPFHKEKTPSFNVVEDKGFYHCFGCGAHGTAIDFVMAIEGLGFPEALERLADLTGIAAPRRATAGQAEPSQRLHAANAAAAAWFQAQLAGSGGKEAQAYLERRGLGREVVRGFGLGYAPNERTALRRALVGQGFAEAELLAAGVLAQADGGGEGFDRFRHRIMFPIADERGRVVGFGGRALGEARAKYLNTPETEIFHKGELLYNHQRASRAAREQKQVVLAEGYMDVIALGQAGLAHAVAPLGTAVTERQLALLWRLAEAPIVCLDGDRAGLAAAMRAAERALPLMRGGQTLRFAMLPDGEDPDSFLRRHGVEPLRAILDKAVHLSVFVWSAVNEHSFRNLDLDRPEQIAALRHKLRSFELLATDRDIRQSLKQRFGELLGERLAGIREARQRTVASRSRSADHRYGKSAGKGAGRAGAAASPAGAASARRGSKRRWRARKPRAKPGSCCLCCAIRNGCRAARTIFACCSSSIRSWSGCARKSSLGSWTRAILTQRPSSATSCNTVLGHSWISSPPTSRSRPRLPLKSTMLSIDEAGAACWPPFGTGQRYDQERPTEEDLRHGDGGQVNRLFFRLDRLLNRDGADDADSDDGPENAAG